MKDERTKKNDASESVAPNINHASENNKNDSIKDNDHSKELVLPLHVYIYTKRMHNGIRHNDYDRYRAYCSRRLRTLRSALNIQNGRKFQRKIFPSNIEDSRYLMTQLVLAERAWSLGMHLRNENSASNVMNSRWRQHAARRFSKASVHAEELLEICTNGYIASQYEKQKHRNEDKNERRKKNKNQDDKDGNKNTKKKTTEEKKNDKIKNTRNNSDKINNKSDNKNENEKKNKDNDSSSWSNNGENDIYPNKRCIVDEKTLLEVKGYLNHVYIYREIEKENYEKASTYLPLCINIYSQLKRVSSTNREEENIYKDILEDLESTQRLCQFNTGKRTEWQGSSVTKHQKVSPSLVSSSAKSSLTSSLIKLTTWRNQDVFLNINDTVGKSIKNVYEQLQSNLMYPGEELFSFLKKFRSSLSSSSFDFSLTVIPLETTSEAENMIEKYGEIAQRYKACVEMIHKEIIRRPDDLSLAIAEGYCCDTSRYIEIERNALLLIRCLGLLRKYEEHLNISTSMKHRFQEGFRYVSFLLQCVDRMLGEDVIQTERKDRLQKWLATIKDTRTLFLSLYNMSIGKNAEAYVLCEAIIARSRDWNPSETLSNHDMFYRLDTIFAFINTFINTYVSFVHYISLSSFIKQQNQLDDLSINNTSLVASKITQILSEKPSENILSPPGSFLVPPLMPVPCKPLLFDMSISAFPPPDISHKKTEQTKKNRIRGMLKSWWNR